MILRATDSNLMAVSDTDFLSHNEMLSKMDALLDLLADKRSTECAGWILPTSDGLT